MHCIISYRQQRRSVLQNQLLLVWKVSIKIVDLQKLISINLLYGGFECFILSFGVRFFRVDKRLGICKGCEKKCCSLFKNKFQEGDKK